MKTRLLAGVAVGAFLLAGCKSTKSENVRTQGITAYFDIEDGSSGHAAAHAQLLIGNTYIQLSDGDGLYCDNVKMTETKDAFNVVDYNVEVPRRTDPGSYQFEFRRPSTGESHISYAFVPIPVVITAPSNASTVDAKKPLLVTWDAGPQGAITISVSGGGDTGHSFDDISDSGSLTIPANEIVCVVGVTPCAGTLSVSRAVVGEGDADFQEVKIHSYTGAHIDLTIAM